MKKNLLTQTESLAIWFLQSMIENKLLPKNFSGVVTPRFGNYIYIWQYDKGNLVGTVMVHKNNCKVISKKLVQAENSNDWKEVFKPQEEAIGSDASDAI